MVLAPFFPPLLSFTRLAPRAVWSRLSFFVSWLKGCSGSLGIYRLRHFLARSLQVVCALLGLAYGSLGVTADILASQGNGRDFHLKPLLIAAKIFPLDRHIREMPAYALLRLHDWVGPEYVVAEVDRALRNDPWAFDLSWDRQMMLLQERNN